MPGTQRATAQILFHLLAMDERRDVTAAIGAGVFCLLHFLNPPSATILQAHSE
jgi:hypothetical protein